MRLDRVTITGADDSIDPKTLVRLSRRFPFVEWGILLSESSFPRGSVRFPSRAWVETLLATDGSSLLQLSGHLCGAWVRSACLGDHAFGRDWPDVGRVAFNRIQFNFHAITHTVRVAEFAHLLRTWSSTPPREFIL